MYDLIIEYTDGTDNVVVPEVSIDEVMDFVEEHDEASAFVILRTAA